MLCRSNTYHGEFGVSWVVEYHPDVHHIPFPAFLDSPQFFYDVVLLLDAEVEVSQCLLVVDELAVDGPAAGLNQPIIQQPVVQLSSHYCATHVQRNVQLTCTS